MGKIDKKRLISDINRELKSKVNLKYKKGSIRFFKEPIKPVGVRAGDTRKIAAKHYREIKNLPKKEIFGLCEELLRTGYMEHGIIAFSWAYQFKNDYSRRDFLIFERWLRKYVHNWAHCDDFCTHAFGALLFQFPELLNKSKKWTQSKNRWEKRAAAVTLIYHAKQKDKKYLKDMFWVADKLLLDEDDLVQKGYGWMLKEAANFWQREVFDYVISKKKIMPRTALRYAIEKMPEKMKRKAMG